MVSELNRYLRLGQFVEIVYQDRDGRLTQRRIRLQSIHGDQLHAFCFTRRSIRTFRIGNILALAPVTFRREA